MSFNEVSFHRYFIAVSYDGTYFHGSEFVKIKNLNLILK